jgi:hypothetical protein
MTKLLSLFVIFVFSISAFAENPHGIFMVVKGEVKITGKDGKTDPAKVGKKVVPGDKIESGKEGRAKIVMSDKNVINISPDTKLIIEKYQNDGTNKNVELNILEGKVRASVEQKYDGEKNKFNIKTPSAVAGVRGTDFLTGYSPATKTAQIITFSGTVAVGAPGPNGKIENPVFVQPGQMTSAGSDGKPAAPAAVPKEQLKQEQQETNADTAKGTTDKPASESKEAKEEKKDEKKEEKKEEKQEEKKEEKKDEKKDEKKEEKKDEKKDEKKEEKKESKKEDKKAEQKEEGGEKQAKKEDSATEKKAEKKDEAPAEQQAKKEPAGDDGKKSSDQNSDKQADKPAAESGPAKKDTASSEPAAKKDSSTTDSGPAPKSAPAADTAKSDSGSKPAAAAGSAPAGGSGPAPDAGPRAPASVGGAPSMITATDLGPGLSKNISFGPSTAPQVPVVNFNPGVPTVVPTPANNQFINDIIKNTKSRVNITITKP